MYIQTKEFSMAQSCFTLLPSDSRVTRDCAGIFRRLQTTLIIVEVKQLGCETSKVPSLSPMKLDYLLVPPGSLELSYVARCIFANEAGAGRTALLSIHYITPGIANVAEILLALVPDGISVRL